MSQTCRKCGTIFGYTGTNEKGQRVNIGRRVHCLECVPFGKRLSYGSRETSEVWESKNIKKLVASSKSYAEVIRKMGYVVSGSTQSRLKKVIESLELDTSHMTHEIWSKGKNAATNEAIKRQSESVSYSWDEVFCENSTINNQSLLRRLILSGKRKYECEECSTAEWNGKPVVLEIHHKNRINTDNREENISILCPNCHSQKHISNRSCKLFEMSKQVHVAQWQRPPV